MVSANTLCKKLLNVKTAVIQNKRMNENHIIYPPIIWPVRQWNPINRWYIIL